MQLFKILTPQQWQNFQAEKIFYGSPLDLTDGFIHLSFMHQWQMVWAKFFKNLAVVLVEINGSLLDPQGLKIEANHPGGEQYPHYYGPLRLEMVLNHPQTIGPICKPLVPSDAKRQ